jgi:hypothetical protein
MRRISPEEKLLRQIIINRMVDRTYPVRQEPPFCNRCALAIDISDQSIKVDFHDIDVRGKIVTVAEPICPKCCERVEAEVNTVH